ncbi:hypothetical protein Pres01_35700 [Metapseudomonas resinovorans]|nr:hypothetical protein [Pseudomonas resinovorans]GLZ87519.1 hypothetical protein Pres01_35700 [Pseudomonas resinovorans]
MYQALLREQLETLKSSNQYRTFTTLSRICGQYPLAKLEGRDHEPVIVWCSNHYLGMSQHPVVREQMLGGVSPLNERMGTDLVVGLS